MHSYRRNLTSNRKKCISLQIRYPLIQCDTGMAQSVWVRTNCANCSHRRICITHLNNTTSQAKGQNKHSKSAAHRNDNCRINTRNNVGSHNGRSGRKIKCFLSKLVATAAYVIMWKWKTNIGWLAWTKRATRPRAIRITIAVWMDASMVVFVHTETCNKFTISLSSVCCSGEWVRVRETEKRVYSD